MWDMLFFTILSASSIAETVSLLGVFFCDFKRDTSLLKRLADKDIEGCTKIHAKFFIKSFGSCFEIAVHADTDIACCRFSHGNHTIINTMAHSLTAQCQACV